jgi:hypothetical protein
MRENTLHGRERQTWFLRAHGSGPVTQRLGNVGRFDPLFGVEVGDCTGDLYHAMVPSRGKHERFGRRMKQRSGFARPVTVGIQDPAADVRVAFSRRRLGVAMTL